MKKILNISLVLLIGLFLLTGCGKEKEVKKEKPDEEPTGIKTNTNKDVVKDQVVENFKFENTSLVYDNGTSTLQTVVTNTSGETTYLREFNIYVKDEKGNEIIMLTGFIGESLEPGETRTIYSSYGDDLTNAASITYEVVR